MMNRFFLGMLVALMVLMCGFVQAGHAEKDNGADKLYTSFPANLAGMRLEHLHEGRMALDEIDALHGKPIAASDALIATYKAPQSPPAQVWVSLADSPQQALQQVQDMVQKMLGAEKSPFHDYQSRDVATHPLHQFYGMGQVHYIWTNGREAWWISAPQDRGDEFLQKFIGQ